MSQLNLTNLSRVRSLTILCWLAAIILILCIIIPCTDDPNYSLPAISFISNGHLASPVGQAGFEYTYYVFPTLSFIEAGFYWLMKQLHIPITFYTYRIPIALFFIGLIYLCFRTIRFARSHTTQRQIIFISILGITMFAQTWHNDRPETPALFFLFLHLIFFYKYLKHPTQKLALFSGFLLGTVVALHPEFSPVVVITFLINCYLARNQSKLIPYSTLSVIGGIFPLLAVFYFYHLHSPQSWIVLYNQIHVAAGSAPFHKFLNDLKGTGMQPLPKMVNSTYYIPSVLMVTYSIFRVIKLIYKKNKLSPIEIHAIGFLISAFLIIKMSWGYPYSIAVGMFLVLYSFSILLSTSICDYLNRIASKKPLLTGFTYCVMATAFIDMHILKFVFFPQKYIFPPRMIHKIENILTQNNAKLLIIDGPYVLLFAHDFQKEFRHPQTDQKVFRLLPSSGQQVETSLDRQKGRKYLHHILTTNPNLVVMSVPPYIKFNVKNKKVTLHLFNSKLKFTASLKKVIYDSGQHKIILANNLKLHEI